jgi:hypothetical protein
LDAGLVVKRPRFTPISTVVGVFGRLSTIAQL